MRAKLNKDLPLLTSVNNVVSEKQTFEVATTEPKQRNYNKSTQIVNIKNKPTNQTNPSAAISDKAAKTNVSFQKETETKTSMFLNQGSHFSRMDDKESSNTRSRLARKNHLSITNEYTPSLGGPRIIRSNAYVPSDIGPKSSNVKV